MCSLPSRCSSGSQPTTSMFSHPLSWFVLSIPHPFILHSHIWSLSPVITFHHSDTLSALHAYLFASWWYSKLLTVMPAEILLCVDAKYAKFPSVLSFSLVWFWSSTLCMPSKRAYDDCKHSQRRSRRGWDFSGVRSRESYLVGRPKALDILQTTDALQSWR